MTPIRVVVIGYGYAGRTFHAPLIRATPGLELVAIVSRNAASVRADLPGMAILDRPGVAFADPAVDLVVIATPHDTHVPLATDALDAAKHVVVEKPLALRVDEARQIASRARRSGRILSVFHNRRWDSDFLGVRDVLSQGAVGQLVQFESHFDRYRPEVRDRWRERAGPAAGLWYDLGPHLIDQALQLFGRPARVTGHLAALRPGSETNDWAHAVLEYPRLRVILHASMVVSGPPLRFALHGTKGSWIRYGLDAQEDQLKRRISPATDEFGVDRTPAIFIDGQTGAETPWALPRGDYPAFYRQVRDAIAGGAPNPVPASDAVAVTDLLDTVIRSGVEGRSLP